MTAAMSGRLSVLVDFPKLAIYIGWSVAMYTMSEENCRVKSVCIAHALRIIKTYLVSTPAVFNEEVDGICGKPSARTGHLDN